MVRTTLVAALLFPTIAWALDTGLDTGAPVDDFVSVPQPLVFEGVGSALDTTYTLPIGFQLDIVIAEFWLGVTPKLTGNSEFGLYVEGTSDLSWSPDDNVAGLLYQGITPVEGSGVAAMKTDVAFEIDFQLFSGGGGPVGKPTVAFPLLSENVNFDLEGDAFTPFLLPEQTPNSASLRASSSDLAFELPLIVPISLAEVAGINVGVIIKGQPKSTVTYGGKELATRYGDFVVGRTGEIQLDEPAPNLELLSQYTASVDANISYQFDVDLSFELEIFGFPVFPIQIPLLGQAFPLFASVVDLDIPSSEYVHPLPQLSFAPAVMTSRSVDLGEVEVGSSGSIDLAIFNDGDLDLVGEAYLDGAPAFSATPLDFSMSPQGESFTVITVEPVRAGPLTTKLVFESNDPYTETITIEVTATGVEPEVSDTGDDTTGRQDEDTFQFQTCGCAQGTPSGAILWLGLLPLLALRRRD